MSLKTRLDGALMRRLQAVASWLEGGPAGRFLEEWRYARIYEALFSHEFLLADGVRTSAYERAIARHVRPGDVVVDVGTGTGILAFLAARRGARVVHAVDRSNAIEYARIVAEGNGIENVSFAKTDSRDFTIGERADVIVHEQIGYAVFDEHLVDCLLDARERLLRPGGRILPNRFDVFFEPVELRPERRVPFAWDFRSGDVAFEPLRALAASVPRSHFRRLLRPEEVQSLLCEPTPSFSFDLETVAAGDLPNRVEARRRVVRDGTYDGLCIYFRASFDDENALGTLPTEPSTCFSVRLLRVVPRAVRAGDEILVDVRMDDLANVDTWRWREGPA